uniref:Omega-amidase YafV n=1 Tax=uncultured Thiotrichaceae bacterium TaxID=298394 RepID=A0A6S6UC79_9GAMM|nr:MAG: Aliphatic amidase AmiE (EC [uncultured Thiotrichaceae bacterium]
MMSEDLRVSLVQSELVWHDPEANRAAFAEKLDALQEQVDLVVLPEMFTTGFTMNPQQAAEVCHATESGLQSDTIVWLQKQAEKLDTAVCGSVAMQLGEGGAYVNRMLFVTPDGAVEHYDKRHLFRMANEHHHYQAGTERKVVEYRGWRILLQVCYDLRFPVFSRNDNDYDLVLYVANWPEPRRMAWRTLLQARAIENYCYTIGVNRVGQDDNGMAYSGDSMAIDFKGDVVLDRTAGESFIEAVQLNKTELNDFREKFPAWQDADAFELM